MRLLAIALLAALAALPASAEDKVEVKMNVKKGLKFTRTVEIKGEGDCRIEAGGRAMVMKTSLENTVKQLEEEQDVKDGVPVAIHRAYPARKTAMNLGLYGSQERPHGLEGTDLAFKGGAWAVTAGGTPEEAAKVIASEKAADPLTDAIASGKAVVVGNTWDADKEKVKAWITSEFPGFEGTEAEMECKLCEFKEKDGHKCVRIEVNAKVTGKFALMGAPQTEVTVTVKGDVFYATDTGMVILVKAEGKLKADVEVQGAQSGHLKLDIPLEWNVAVKVGEADFSAAKPVDKPKPVKPETFPPPVR